jgi:hypothetical protein
MIFTKDNIKLGLILGFLGPLAGLVILYFLKFPSTKFSDFIDYFIHDNALITSIGSLSLLANVVLFTVYLNTHKDETAKGIFAITVVYGIAILAIKLINS